MKRETLTSQEFPNISIEILEGDSSGSEGLMEGWTRVKILNAAGGVSTTQDYPYLPPYLDEETDNG